MIVLGLDTTLGACSAAIYDASAARMLAEERVLLERGHAEILFAQIARVLASAGLALKDIDRFAVTLGPGTFTGVRIGLSAARGFALASGKEIVGVGTLDVIASGAEIAEEALLVATLDARRGEIYYQAFRGRDAVANAAIGSLSEAAQAVVGAARPGERIVAIGSGASLLREAIEERGVQAAIAPGDALPHAARLVRLAATRPKAPAPPLPLYLRAPDAKLPAPAPGR